MSHEHRNKWAPPPSGWPTFDEDGKIVKEDDDTQEGIDTVQPD